MTVFTGLNHCATRTTNGIGAEAVFEQHSLSSKLIDIWRRINFLEPAIISSNRMGSMIIGEDKDNVRAIFRSQYTGGQKCQEQ